MSYREQVGVGSWVRRWWRALVAEVVSTALLVWLGCAPLVPIAGPDSVVLTHPAFAFGFMVVGNICAFGEASGAHMNPAVTLGAVIYGQLGVIPALAYIVAQLLGGIIGFAGLMATAPPDLIAGGVAVTLPAKGVTPLAALLLEVVMTGMLVLAICGVWGSVTSEQVDTSSPLKFGVVVAGLVYAGGPWTGASINPARSFAPALLQGIWRHHWVYWVGPLLGGALAALLHRYIITPQRVHSNTRVTATTDMSALNNKP